MKFLLHDAQAQLRAQLSFFCLQGNSYALQMFKRGPTDDLVTGPEWATLLAQGVEHARSVKAADLMIRVIDSLGSPALDRALEGLGFTRGNGRIEFRAPLDRLPLENGSPLRWQTTAELGWSLDKSARFLKQVAENDPDFSPDENPQEVLQGYLDDEGLTHGPECFQVGFITSEPVAFVVAQIDPKPSPKWSRITYMGMIPERRGQGLGKWVHRHGFAMMRAQGGELYHGGTLAQNAPMLRLFRDHGCEEYRRMQEWVIRF